MTPISNTWVVMDSVNAPNAQVFPYCCMDRKQNVNMGRKKYGSYPKNR